VIVREVEAESIRSDNASRLVDVVSEHLPQRPVHQMRSGVVSHRIHARGVYFQGDGLADSERPFFQNAQMQNALPGQGGIANDKSPAVECQHPGVSDLSTLLAVKVCSVEDYRSFVPNAKRTLGDKFVVLYPSDHLRFDRVERIFESVVGGG